MRKKFFVIFRFLATAGIIFALFKFIPYTQIVEVYKDSEKIYLILAFFTFVSSYIIGIFRWRFFLASLEIKVPLSELFYAFFSGLFFNLFFPSYVAGDVFRGVSIAQRYGDRKKVASSVLMDRYSGASALVLMVVISVYVAGLLGRNLLQDGSVYIAVSILASLMAFSSLIIFSKPFFSLFTTLLKPESKLRIKVESFHDQLLIFKNKPSILLKSLFFSFPTQLLTAIGFFLASRAFSLDLSVLYFLILVPIVMGISLVPITIAGAGTREAAAVYFFSLIGIDKSIGLGMSLLNFLFMVSTGILGGIIYVSIYHRRLQPDT